MLVSQLLVASKSPVRQTGRFTATSLAARPPAAFLVSTNNYLQEILEGWSSYSFTKRHLKTSPSTEVVIVGGGPVGLVSGILLSQFGIQNVVLEEAAGPSSHPKAHSISNRTMEIFRTLFLPRLPTKPSLSQSSNTCSRPLRTVEQAVQESVPPMREWRAFRYVDQLVNGQLYGMVDHFPGQAHPGDPNTSPATCAHLPQHKLLPILVESTKAQPLCSLRFNHSVQSVEQAPGLVKVNVQNEKGQDVIFGRYLLATEDALKILKGDGAGSPIRKQLGLGWEGTSNLQHLVNIHFKAPLLGQCLLSSPAMLYFVYSPQSVLVLVAHDLRTGEFVAQVPFFPPMESAADFTKVECRRRLELAAGTALTDLEILQVLPWTMHAQVTPRFQQGRIFLVGDAAHRFPPSGGLGMNTGISDAHNIAWKLAFAVKQERMSQENKSVDTIQGASLEKLMASYEAERRPIALVNTALSLQNWEEALQVPAVLGLEHAYATTMQSIGSALHGAAGATPLRQVVKSAFSLVVTTGMSTGGLHGPFKGLRREAVKKLLASGNTLRLNFAAFDLGMVYSCKNPENIRDAKKYVAQADRHAPFQQRLVKGGRLPHAWLRRVGAEATQDDVSAVRGKAERKDEQVTFSTVDLVRMWPGRPLVLASERAEDLVEWLAPRSTCGDFEPVLCLLLGSLFRDSCRPGAEQGHNRYTATSEQFVRYDTKAQDESERVSLRSSGHGAETRSKSDGSVKPLHSSVGGPDADVTRRSDGQCSASDTENVDAADGKAVRLPRSVHSTAASAQKSAIDRHLPLEATSPAGPSSRRVQGDRLNAEIVRLQVEGGQSVKQPTSIVDMVVVRPDGHVAWFGSAQDARAIFAQGIKVEHLLVCGGWCSGKI